MNNTELWDMMPYTLVGIKLDGEKSRKTVNFHTHRCGNLNFLTSPTFLSHGLLNHSDTLLLLLYPSNAIQQCRSQWPRGLRRESAAVRLLGLRVRITPEAWMSVSCECCVLSGRGLCDGSITRLEVSCRVCVSV
jgi:hypothetical protein